jgi:PKD repeat protein
MCRAQEEEKYYDANTELDTACFYFKKLTKIDFDVSQKNGCEFLITQLLNQTAYFSRDTLYYQWSVFNDDRSIYFVFDEENPDLFLYESGNYHIELIITNIYGCSDTLTKYNMISIDKMPQVNFTFTPENALFGEYFGEVVFTNLTDPELLNDSTTTWYWDMGDHVMNRFEQSPVHLFSMWGDYHTTFHLQTKNGCKVALTKTVTIENELFFPDTLKNNSSKSPPIFAVTNLNTYIPKDDPNGFRTNHLFVYDKTGKQIYEQKNYDTYIKNKNIVEGSYALSVTDLESGEYNYSFFYKGESKMVHYSGNFWVER